jgi:hypothetical protein
MRRGRARRGVSGAMATLRSARVSDPADGRTGGLRRFGENSCSAQICQPADQRFYFFSNFNSVTCRTKSPPFVLPRAMPHSI